MRLPWSIAAAAKASIVYGNEHRSGGVTHKDVFEICALYNALDDPLTHTHDDPASSVGAFLVRISHEQFASQQSRYEEISRLGALFEGLDCLDTEMLDQATVEGLLGCTVQEFVGAGLIFAVGATKHAGFFDPDWAGLWNGPGAISKTMPMDMVSEVFRQHFLTDFGAFQAESARYAQADARLRHHEYNPLVARPFVTLPDGRHVAPQPDLIYQRLSPSAVYFAGVNSLGKSDAAAFTRDIGLVFQDYVGRQLRLAPGAVVIPEIYYDNDQRSVDWFLIFDEVVVMIEVKSTSLSNLARMGGAALGGDVKRCLGRALNQLRRTEEILTSGHRAFAHIPKDRKRVGLVVTLEPYWAANSPFVRRLLPECPLPVAVASSRELELFIDVARADGGPSALLRALADEDRRHWNLSNALQPRSVTKNPILEAAWKAYPFGD